MYAHFHLVVDGRTVQFYEGEPIMNQATIDYYGLDEWLAYERRQKVDFGDVTPSLRATHGIHGIRELETIQ